MPATILATPARGRMQAVALIELGDRRRCRRERTDRAGGRSRRRAPDRSHRTRARSPARDFGGASMPHNSTSIRRAFRRRTISASASRVTLGSTPRSMSLAPSSRITASVPSGTDQSSRASPPELVSPDTPALAISTARPLALSARSSWAGNAVLGRKLIAGGQRIAERHDLDGPFGRAAGHPTDPCQGKHAERQSGRNDAGRCGPASHMSGARTSSGGRRHQEPHERHLHCGR